MTIHLTIDEIRLLVAKQLGLAVNGIELAISYPRKTPIGARGLFKNLLDKFLNNGICDSSYMIKKDQQIQAIKELRQFYLDNGLFQPLLISVKNAVVEWPTFYKYCLKKGLPGTTELNIGTWLVKKDLTPEVNVVG